MFIQAFTFLTSLISFGLIGFLCKPAPPGGDFMLFHYTGFSSQSTVQAWGSTCPNWPSVVRNHVQRITVEGYQTLLVKWGFGRGGGCSRCTTVSFMVVFPLRKTNLVFTMAMKPRLLPNYLVWKPPVWVDSFPTRRYWRILWTKSSTLSH